jgi:hypothetical protein
VPATEAGIEVQIIPRPVELADAVLFADDHGHASYHPSSVERFRQALLNCSMVMREFQRSCLGKASAVHYPGAFALALTRFSGRPAPRHPGGVPNCPDWVMNEAYSHEVSSFSFWPVGGQEGLFYRYAYPQPLG